MSTAATTVWADHGYWYFVALFVMAVAFVIGVSAYVSWNELKRERAKRNRELGRELARRNRRWSDIRRAMQL